MFDMYFLVELMVPGTKPFHTCNNPKRHHQSHVQMRTQPLEYHRGNILERDKFDVDKFGSPTSYQIFPSILRMRCVKGQQPSRGHQEITAAIHYEATARDFIPKFSFISKDQFQIFPPLILAFPKKNPQIIPPVVVAFAFRQKTRNAQC